MRLIFLYTADGPAPVGSGRRWNPKGCATNYFAQNFHTEGYFAMLKGMLDCGIVDEVLVVIESSRGPGFKEFQKNMTCLVTPEIANIRPMLRADDVIFCRGGFRTWFPFLTKAREEGRWLLLYAANTGRERWTFWDVVFDDLAGRDFIDDAGRIHLDFRKPTNPDTFYLKFPGESKYDLCIGASRVHDKKGQWRGVEVARNYHCLFGKHLKCILPGSFSHGEKTSWLKEIVTKDRLDITFTGPLDRHFLAEVMNRSKVFCHLGSGGQGDRGPMEAMNCGCKLIIGYPAYHAPWVWQNNDVAWVPDDPDDYMATAIQIHNLISTDHDRQAIADYHNSQAGLYDVILPRMERLFSIFKKQPLSNKEYLRKEFNL